MVVVSLSGANRDASKREQPRGGTGARRHRSSGSTRIALPAPHYAFGHGFHRCIGAELARIELRAAYPALVRRFPEMSLAVDPAELNFRKLSIVYGVEALPVRWD